MVLLGVGLVACSELDSDSDGASAEAAEKQNANGSAAGAGGAVDALHDGADRKPEPTPPPGHPYVAGGATGILEDETSAGAGGAIPASGDAPPAGEAGATGVSIASGGAPPAGGLELSSACLACASDSCSKPHESCISNPDCLLGLYCANACPDAGCRAACIEPYPKGLSDLTALLECLASSCSMCTE